jgi:hypothetical protein
MAAILFCGLLLGSCASAGPAFRIGDTPEFRDKFPRESCESENINGEFPDAVYIKTRTQTFNTYHYYVLKDGYIWYKGITGKSGPEDWTLFMETGLPHNKAIAGFVKADYIAEISADADELVALSRDGRFYRICFDWIFSRRTGEWMDKQGWPVEEGLYLDGRAAGNISWALGKRNDQVRYYEDPFGNQHHNGTMEIATTYVLLEDGKEICFADTGLPCDFSRNFIGPEKGAFKAAALAASASTMFLIGENGEMFTRLADFDVVGCDPMFVKYTYVPYVSDLQGVNYASNLSPWGLPPEDWRKQPPIPGGVLTRHITILQNGQGNGARELRAAGLNEDGITGYWSKEIFGESWEFKPVPLYFSDGAFLRETDPAGANEVEAVPFRGYMWDMNKREEGWDYEIADFNILEGSCSLKISRKGESCVLLLHPVEMWTYLKRDYLPGRNGPPKVFFATLEIPADAMEGLSDEFKYLLEAKFRSRDKTLFHYIMEASDGYLLLWDGSGSVLLLTRGGVPKSFPEFRYAWVFSNYGDRARFDSPALKAEGPLFTRSRYAELREKTAANIRFQKELQNRIAEYEIVKNTAANTEAAYNAFDIISKITMLNFIDVPKIYTVTQHGGRIVSANKSFTDMVSDNRIWLNQKILELLEVRIKVYADTADRLARGEREVFFPKGFAESIPEYLGLAGFPSGMNGISGEGKSSEPARLSSSQPDCLRRVHTQDPACAGEACGGTKDMYPESNTLPKQPYPDRSAAGLVDYGFFGWVLEAGSFSFLIEPRDVPRLVFSRNGRPAGEKSYRFRGNLFVISADISSDEDWMPVLPLIKGDKGAPVDIRFDGTNLTIKLKRPFQKDTVIFQGTIF